jgi:AcrR family transcriptional regulator
MSTNETKSPSDRRFLKTRQGILDAARSIIMENGIAALSIRHLAEQVDYSPAAIYKYFQNKEEILKELRAEGWRLMAQEDQGVPKNLPPEKIFLAMAQNYLRFAKNHPDHYLLIMSPTDDIPASLEDFINGSNFNGFIQYNKQLVASGLVKLPEGYTPVHLAFLNWFIVHAVSMLRITMMRKCQKEFDALSTEVIEMAMQMIL